MIKLGDTVKVIGVKEPEDKEVVGRTGQVTKIKEASDGYTHYVSNMPSDNWRFAPSQLKLIKSKEGATMGKYYKVIKETPVWEVGAILVEDDDGENYSALNDLFVKDLKDVDADYAEMAAVVEHAEDFFARVYEVKLLGKAKYLTKIQARQAHEELYKTK